MAEENNRMEETGDGRTCTGGKWLERGAERAGEDQGKDRDRQKGRRGRECGGSLN